MNFFETFLNNRLQNIDIDNIKNLCQSMKYERFNAGSSVFEEEDPCNNKFYIILSGKVAITIKEKNRYYLENSSEFVTEKVDNAEKKQKLFLITQPLDKSLPYNQVNHGKNNRHSKSSLGEIHIDKGIKLHDKKIRELTTGESFGEKALESIEPRSTSIICITDCDLIILQKSDYAYILTKMKKNREEFFLKVFPFLATSLSSKALDNLLYSFKVFNLILFKFILF